MPNQKNVKTLQSFFGLVSYYQDFIELLRKEKKSIWTKESEQAFREIKNKLTSDNCQMQI